MGGHLDAARHAGDETRAWAAGRAAVSACPSCRAPAPDGARFCPACGSSVATEIHKPTERKVVTMLFADLVGFTALGERYDPDPNSQACNRVINAPFNPQARTLISRYLARVFQDFIQANAAYQFDAIRVGGGVLGELRYPPPNWNGHADA